MGKAYCHFLQDYVIKIPQKKRKAKYFSCNHINSKNGFRFTVVYVKTTTLTYILTLTINDRNWNVLMYFVHTELSIGMIFTCTIKPLQKQVGGKLKCTFLAVKM